MPEPILTGFGNAVLDPVLPVPANLTGPKGRPAGNRFGVYRNNVIAGLGNALAESFPVVRKLVGGEFFTAMAAIYVRAHPPKSPLMMYYGDDFAAFLETFAPTDHLPYLPDVARLEHIRRLAFHAADAIPAGGAALASIPKSDLPNTHLRLLPSVFLLTSKYPVFSIWRYNSTADQSPLPPRGEAVLIARPFGEVEMRVLPDGALEFLSSLQAGASLGEAVETGTKAARGFDMAAQLSGILQSNILAETYQ